MVHWGRPTTPAMARQHKLQLALLLEMDKKESAQHTIGNGCLQLAAGLIEAELAAGERIFGVLDANNRRVRRNSPMMSSGTSSCRTHRGGTMRRPGCCCSLGSRAAQVYWLAKCHTPLASAIGPKRPSTQPQTTATYKTPYAHPHIQTHCHLEHRQYPNLLSTQPSHSWICDTPTPLLHPTTSSTPNFKLQTSQARSRAQRRAKGRKGRVQLDWCITLQSGLHRGSRTFTLSEYVRRRAAADDSGA